MPTPAVNGSSDGTRAPEWPSPEVAARLLPLLQDAFGYHVHLFPTPNMTGRHLWTLTRPEWKEQYPPLPEDLQTFYRGTSGQGRTVVTTLPELETIPAAYLYDMRFAYAGACENLPVGPPEREQYATPRPFDRGDRYVKGRYRITFRVPDDWHHIGIFMVPRDRRNTGWEYPDAPGTEHETWASNGEIALAINQGWKIAVHERIVFPHEKAAPRPLDVWIRRLSYIWYDAGHRGPRDTRPPDPVDSGVRAAIRDIVLQTIGGFHAHRRREEVPIPDSEPLPAGVRPRWNQKDRTYTYVRWVPLPARDIPYQHPEWAIEVWARTRTKLLSHHGIGALHIPREHLLGIRTDALYLSQDPGWQDLGIIGAFRPKASQAGPLPAPHDSKALRALVTEVE